MSIPPQIAAALAGGAGGQKPPTANGMPPPTPGPGGAPMMQPQPKQGNEAGARADIQVCIKKLTMALQTFAPDTDTGKAIMKAIGALTKSVGKTEGKDQELVPAEISQAISKLAGPGKPAPGTPQPPGAAPIPPPM